MNEGVSEWRRFLQLPGCSGTSCWCCVMFYLSSYRRVDTTYAPTQVGFISHTAVVTHEKKCTKDFPEVLSLLGGWQYNEYLNSPSEMWFWEGRGPWTQHQNLCVWLLHQCAPHLCNIEGMQGDVSLCCSTWSPSSSTQRWHVHKLGNSSQRKSAAKTGVFALKC